MNRFNSAIYLLQFFLILSLFSCTKVNETEKLTNVGYDVILVIGQSNTHQGQGLNPNIDVPEMKIKQLGRFGGDNLKIITAKEPLDHFTKLQKSIGFALTFAKSYQKKYLIPGRMVLIIPGGMGSTGFGSHYWNVGDTLYNDAVSRTNFVLKNPDSKLVAILWHQGESDIGNPNYQQNLDSMILHIRKDIIGKNADVPFILGGMVPYWVHKDANRIILNHIIEQTVSRIRRTGYANPEIPFLILKPDSGLIPEHYNAAGQREMGRRYFSEYDRIRIMERNQD